MSARSYAIPRKFTPVRPPTAKVLVDEAEGSIILVKGWLSKHEADELLGECKKLPTEFYDFKIYGHPLKHNRQLWACGDRGVVHKFLNRKVPVNEWNKPFERLRDRLEKEYKSRCNFCLVNHYRDGQDSIAQHRDGELYADRKLVATVSLGGTRTFEIVKEKERRSFQVEHGDLFVMIDDIQSTWTHGIDKEQGAQERYSLTFRGALKE